MIFFTIPRAFLGEFDRLQRLAIVSWLGAIPDARVVLMGDEPGTEDAAHELGCVHIPTLECNPQGTPLIRSAFAEMDRHWQDGLLCEISADILLGADLADVLPAIEGLARPFVVGQRWDIEPGASHEAATLHPPCGVDYFIYRAGTLGEIPPFAVGRTAYDNWLVWAAMQRWNLQVIDATEAITAIHVNHGYPAWLDGKQGLLSGLERDENQRLFRASGADRYYGINDTPWVMRRGGAIEGRQ